MGLTIRVIDEDPDYLLVEIVAIGGRFSGTTRVYTGFDALSELADVLKGFPRDPQDERIHAFGSRDARHAGGYCRVRFACRDLAGHAVLEVDIEDDVACSTGRGAFNLPIEAADLDRFVEQLRSVERSRSGEAQLPEAV